MGKYYVENLGTIHYHQYGSGSEFLFVFHGFGMDGKQFNVLEDYFLKKYNIIGINLFYHGETTLDDNSLSNIQKGLSKIQINQLIAPLIEQFQIKKFSIAGYSLGANYALSLIEYYAENINKVYLFAPDGLKIHKGFKFLSNNKVGNWIFRKLTFHPTLMVNFLKIIYQLKLLNDELYKIAYNEIDHIEKRKVVYNHITFQKNIIPNLPLIEQEIRKFQIPIDLIFGKNDHLFPAKNAKSFLLNYEHKRLVTVDFGHWLVTKELDQILISK